MNNKPVQEDRLCVSTDEQDHLHPIYNPATLAMLLQKPKPPPNQPIDHPIHKGSVAYTWFNSGCYEYFPQGNQQTHIQLRKCLLSLHASVAHHVAMIVFLSVHQLYFEPPLKVGIYHCIIKIVITWGESYFRETVKYHRFFLYFPNLGVFGEIRRNSWYFGVFHKIIIWLTIYTLLISEMYLQQRCALHLMYPRDLAKNLSYLHVFVRLAPLYSRHKSILELLYDNHHLCARETCMMIEHEHTG